MPRAWRLPEEQRGKPDVSQRKTIPTGQPRRLKQIVPAPVPLPATAAFEVHEGLPTDIQQPVITTMPGEGDATPRSLEVAERADYKMDIATLLASKSTLREAILFRELLGTPRGLQPLDITSNSW
jgi:hypothetical protein